MIRVLSYKPSCRYGTMQLPQIVRLVPAFNSWDLKVMFGQDKDIMTLYVYSTSFYSLNWYAITVNCYNFKLRTEGLLMKIELRFHHGPYSM